MSTFDRIIGRDPRSSRVTFAVRPEEADRLAKARAEVEQADQLVKIYKDEDSYRVRLDEAEAELAKVEAEVVTFTVHMSGVGPSTVREMIAAHPATKEQRTKARREANGNPGAEPEFDIDAFAPVLLSSVVTKIEFSDDPDNVMDGLSEEQAEQLWSKSKWSEGDRNTLFNTAMGLDATSSLVEDLGKG